MWYCLSAWLVWPSWHGMAYANSASVGAMEEAINLQECRRRVTSPNRLFTFFDINCIKCLAGRCLRWAGPRSHITKRPRMGACAARASPIVSSQLADYFKYSLPAGLLLHQLHACIAPASCIIPGGRIGHTAPHRRTHVHYGRVLSRTEIKGPQASLGSPQP